ncbi:divalent metal cation transporter [Cellulomonas sp. Sa3CUA2]|uniref:Divalent metal cation transporter n=1 Tax=Cellulomonas avistercoris TaxID=2762242 RepID=A0ABR8QGQ7_9CELL|nr:divalent metal cation transporter [Cellulomonas avistercoris]MBD7919603.1 divalent metal cation transporter [Cellulomonas avistercoris]
MTAETETPPPAAPAADGVESPRGFGAQLRRSGPAFLAGGLNIGSASVTNSVLLAAATGFMFGWVFIPAVLAVYVATLICVRITVVTKRDPIDAIRTYVHPVVGTLNAVAIVLVNLVFHAVNAVLAGLALNALFPQVNIRVWTVVALAVTAVLALLPGKIKVANAVLKYLIMALALSYLVSLFIVPVDWGGFFSQTFSFSLPSSRSEVLLFTAVLSSALAINVPVIQAYASRSTGYGTSSLKLVRFETGASNVLLLVVQFAVLIVVGSTLFPEGIKVTSALEAGAALEPVAGSFATVLFAVGLLGACITTLAVQTQVNGYVVSDLMGWKRDIAAPRFKIVQIVTILLALTIPILGLDPFQWTTWGSAFNSTFMPIGVATWWYLVNKRSIMGRYRAGKWMNVLIAVTMLIATTAAVRFWYITLVG